MKNLILILTFVAVFACSNKPILINGIVVSASKQPVKFSELLVFEQTQADTIGIHDFYTGMQAYKIKKADYKSAFLSNSAETIKLKNEVEAVDSLLAFKLIRLKNFVTIKTLTNDGGEFSFSVTPGKYFILVTDKSDYDITYVECNGLVSISPITVLRENNQKVIIEF